MCEERMVVGFFCSAGLKLSFLVVKLARTFGGGREGWREREREREMVGGGGVGDIWESVWHDIYNKSQRKTPVNAMQNCQFYRHPASMFD